MRPAHTLALTLAITAFFGLGGCEGWGQTYPTRTIQVVVAYAAGGTGDIVARSVADKLGTTLGQSVVVENRAGASG
ncbi:MAG: tripartite tricarboxylate transporter substrate binding protein, partial [Pseudolabrys sp.]